MRIKLSHLRYAFMRTAWILVVFAALLAGLAIWGGRSLEDIAWGALPGFVIWLISFLYWAWRTQEKRADNPRPGEWS
jgi:hypothetical protein